MPTLAGMGALRSTANDLLTFLGAELGFGNAVLKDSMAKQLSVRRPTDTPNLDVALGWAVLSSAKGTIIWHTGTTGGYHAFIGFNPATRTGVVVLANAPPELSTDDIGRYLLLGLPLANPQPPKVHTEISLDTNTKRSFVGQYQLSPNITVAFTLEGDRLFAQASGQKKVEVFPESPTQVFFKTIDVQVTFVTGADGRAASIILHQNGGNIPGKRVEAPVP